MGDIDSAEEIARSFLEDVDDSETLREAVNTAMISEFLEYPYAERMAALEVFFNHELSFLYPDEDYSMILNAFQFARQKHGEKKRYDRTYQFEHVVRSARIGMYDLSSDFVTLQADLLHDVVEDTGASLREVKRLFGNEVRYLVYGATGFGVNDGNPPTKFYVRRVYKTREKIRRCSERDPRIVEVKAADRIDNLSELANIPLYVQWRMAIGARDDLLPLCPKTGKPRVSEHLQRAVDPVLKRLETPEAMREVYKGALERTLMEYGVSAPEYLIKAGSMVLAATRGRMKMGGYFPRAFL